MSEAFNICEQIPRVSDSRSETRNFIRSFASHWVTPIDEGDGYNETELLASEKRLGIPLPEALKEAYALFGSRSDLIRNQEYLLEPAALYVDHGALIFRHENQGAAIWEILLAGLLHPDPPVDQCFYIVDNVVDEWRLWLGRLSFACIDLTLWVVVRLEDANRVSRYRRR